MDQEQFPMHATASTDNMQAALYNTSDTPSYSSLEVIGDMLSTPAQLDWVRYSFFCQSWGWEH
jgi:hypothetical protein